MSLRKGYGLVEGVNGVYGATYVYKSVNCGVWNLLVDGRVDKCTGRTGSVGGGGRTFGVFKGPRGESRTEGGTYRMGGDERRGKGAFPLDFNGN